MRLFADTQHLRSDDGGYWTGYVYPDEVHWPAEHTTFTTAAVLLAHDALTGQTPGADLVRGDGSGARPGAARARVRLRVSRRCSPADA